MAKQLRVGIIGAGLVGRLHISGYEKAGARVVAVADVQPAAAEAAARASHATPYTEYQEMLDTEDLDAVSVCSPPAMHLAAAVAAAQRGFAVLCEKPLAESAASARELVEAVGATGVPFMVGFFHRFHEPLVTLRRLIVDGTFGRQLVVRSRFSLVGRDDNRPWASDPAISGGGAVMNSAVHSLDAIRFLTGAELRVNGAALASTGTAGKLEDTAVIVLNGGDDVLAIVEAYGGAPFKHYELWLQGPNGEAIVSWEPPGLRLRTVGHQEWHDVPTSAATALERIDRGISYFCGCVTEGRHVQQATGEDGLRAVELAQSAYRVS